MRSISIVYKLRDGRTEELVNPLKRSVDHYYRQLMEKERVKEEVEQQKQEHINHVRIKNARVRKDQDEHQLYATMNVMSIPVQPSPIPSRREISRSQPRLISTQRRNLSSQKMLRGLQRPQIAFTDKQASQTQKGVHCRLKKMVKFSAQSIKDTVIVLSANLLVNQHCFWEEEGINEGCIRYWRELQSHANLVWVCEKEVTARKLLKFSKIFNLRLDSVYALINRGSKAPTVSFGPIESEYTLNTLTINPLKQQKKMIIFTGLNIDSCEEMDFRSFQHAVPIINNRRTVIHFIRIDSGDKNRIGNVLRVLGEENLPRPFNINGILLGYQKASRDQNRFSECNCGKEGKISLQIKLEQSKTRLVQHFSQSMSMALNQRVTMEGGSDCSLQFLIGDMMRRNFRVGLEMERYNSGYKQYRHMQDVHLKKRDINVFEKKLRRKMDINGYNNFTYLWQF